MNVKEFAQDTGEACVLVDRGLKYTGIEKPVYKDYLIVDIFLQKYIL